VSGGSGRCNPILTSALKETKIKETTTFKNAGSLLIIAGVMMVLSVVFSPVKACAQSFTIINHTQCFQWIIIHHSAGRVKSFLNPNAQVIKENQGTGILGIKAGPTASYEDMNYTNRIDIQPNLSGRTWRIEMDPDSLKVIDGDNNWTEVINHPANLGRCNFSGKQQAQGLSPKN